MSAPQIFTPEYYRHMRELEARGWWNAAMRDVAAALLEEAELPAEGVLLDAGCGSGQTMEWFLAARPGWQAAGLDVAPEGLTAGTAAGVPNLLQASVLELPVATASVDMVITLDVLQHLPLRGGDRTALREFRRVLRPGGHLFIRTNAQSFPHAPDDEEASFHKYEPRELRGKLEEAGFSVQRIGRLNALLGLAEIPRELRSAARTHRGYQGILAQPGRPGPFAELKRAWLRQEGRLLRAGVPLPLGRTLIALCRT